MFPCAVFEDAEVAEVKQPRKLGFLVRLSQIPVLSLCPRGRQEVAKSLKFYKFD